MVPASPYIIDTTLRDGEQSPGVVFNGREKFIIAYLLHQLGINEVEAGTPAISKEERQSIKAIASAGFSFKTSCWCRAVRQDILAASKLGTDNVNISLPVSDIQIKTLQKSRKWVHETLKDTLTFAKSYFSFVTFGAQDASRADKNFLKEFIEAAFELGADRIRISDTVGKMDPMETAMLFHDLRKDFPTNNLEFHGHNDLGMATSNTVTALKSGANCVSATVNGIGERAGNASLEEIVAILAIKHDNRQFNKKIIHSLCHYVSEITNRPIPVNKAIVGQDTFAHESGVHTSAMIKNMKSYQIIDPEDFGNKHSRIVFGKHSGKKAIEFVVKSAGKKITETELETLFKEIKSMAQNEKKQFTENEVLAMYKNVSSKAKMFSC